MGLNTYDFSNKLFICQSNKPCNLSINVTPSRKSAKPGDIIDFSLELKNDGSRYVNQIGINAPKIEYHEGDNKIILNSSEVYFNKSRINCTVKDTDCPGPLNIEFIANGTSPCGEINAIEQVSINLNCDNVILNKTATPTVARVGDNIVYRYDVKNEGGSAVSHLKLIDDRLGEIKLNKTELRPEELTSTSRGYTLTHEDLPGPRVNNATLTYLDSEGNIGEVNDSASVSIINVILNKTATPTVARVGDKIVYRYDVKNEGGSAVSHLSLNDDRLGNIKLNKTELVPNELTSTSRGYTLTHEDLPGPRVNNATLTYLDSEGNIGEVNDSASVSIISVILNKTATPTVARVGDKIVYRYDVKNEGGSVVSNLSLNDDRLGNIKLNKTELVPNELTSASRGYTITHEDLPGPRVNNATLTYLDSEGHSGEVNDSASVSIINVILNKTATPTVARVGDNIVYRYDVKNEGGSIVSNLSLIDDRLGEIKLNKTELGPNEVISASRDYTVTRGDLPGPLVNNATISAKDNSGNEVQDGSTACVYLANIVLHKTPDKNMACIGDQINYTYDIENSGSANIFDLHLVDDKIEKFSQNKSMLLPGEKLQFNSSSVAEESGYLNNTATLTYRDPTGKEGSTSEVASVDVNCINFTKTASVNVADIGQVIRYNYTIKNRLSLPLTDLTIDDNLIGPLQWNKSSLQPGETATISATYVVKASDMPGPLVNVAHFTAHNKWNRKIAGFAEAWVNLNYSDLQITKTSLKEPVRMGDLIDFTITVANNGPSMARDVRIRDIIPPNCILYSVIPSSFGQNEDTWKIGDLNSGQNVIIHVILQPVSPGSVSNSARIYSGSFDPIPGNNESTVLVNVLPCLKDFCECTGSQTNYVNVTNEGQISQVFSNGPAILSNVSQTMNNSQY